MDQDTVDIDGQEFELTIPNASRIRAAIRKMRYERDEARRAAQLRQPLGLDYLRDRHNTIVEEARRLSCYFRPELGRPELVKLANQAPDREKIAGRKPSANSPTTRPYPSRSRTGRR